MSISIEDILIKSRKSATNEERIVLALESISDSLVKLSKERPANTSYVKNNAHDAWENEGGSLHMPSTYLSDIECHLVTQYNVGPFRYDKLIDAVAQARRVRINMEQASNPR